MDVGLKRVRLTQGELRQNGDDHALDARHGVHQAALLLQPVHRFGGDVPPLKRGEGKELSIGVSRFWGDVPPL